MGKMSRLKARPNRRTTVTFPYDPTDSDRYEQLAGAKIEARRHLDDVDGLLSRPGLEATDLQQMRGDATAALDAATAALDEYLASIPTITFNLASCGAKKAEKLLLAHPPTDDQQARTQAALKAEGKRGVLQFNEDTFPPALIAACTTSIVITGDEPETITDVTAEDLTELFAEESWATGDVAELLTRCQVLAQVGTSIDRATLEHLGKG